MTWEQAVATVLAIAVTALARLVNQWLPPAAATPSGEPGAHWANTEPMAGPPAATPAESTPYPPLPTQPPDEGQPTE
jgi:hypothetical protein